MQVMPSIAVETIDSSSTSEATTLLTPASTLLTLSSFPTPSTPSTTTTLQAFHYRCEGADCSNQFPSEKQFTVYDRKFCSVTCLLAWRNLHHPAKVDRGDNFRGNLDCGGSAVH